MTTRSIVITAVLGLAGIPVGAAERTGVVFGVEGGAAIEQMIGSKPSSNVTMAVLHLQALNQFGHAPSSRPAHLQLINEVSLIESLHPSRRFIVGASEGLRVSMGPGPWQPFADATAGISSYGLRVHENSGWMQYELQIGLGIKKTLSGRSAVLLRYAATHFSNNGTTKPNDGLNLHAVLVGINF